MILIILSFKTRVTSSSSALLLLRSPATPASRPASKCVQQTNQATKRPTNTPKQQLKLSDEAHLSSSYLRWSLGLEEKRTDLARARAAHPHHHRSVCHHPVDSSYKVGMARPIHFCVLNLSAGASTRRAE